MNGTSTSIVEECLPHFADSVKISSKISSQSLLDMLICRTSRTNSFNLQSFWPALCHQFFSDRKLLRPMVPLLHLRRCSGVRSWRCGSSWCLVYFKSLISCWMFVKDTLHMGHFYLQIFFLTLNGRLGQLRIRRSLGKRTFASFFGVLWISHSRKDLHLCLPAGKVL